jgi:transcription antitermination factor NusG
MAAKNLKFENHLDELEARWFAIYTPYKREKTVQARLDKQGITTYLPLLHLTRYYTRKSKQVAMPLFNCYLFVKITKKEYIRVLETPDVLRFVRFSRNLISIPQQEIDLVRRVVGEGLEITVESLGLNAGDSVEIIGGNLTGVRGKLIKKEGKERFLVELHTLGMGLEMQIDQRLLRKTTIGVRY